MGDNRSRFLLSDAFQSTPAAALRAAQEKIIYGDKNKPAGSAGPDAQQLQLLMQSKYE